jgi:hypothetical protein
MTDPHTSGYNTNIGLRQKSEAVDITAISTSESAVVRRILAIWIQIWLALLLGIIALPLAICEIIMIWDHRNVEIMGIEKGQDISKAIRKRKGLRVNTSEKKSSSGSQKSRYEKGINNSLLSLTILPGCFNNTVDSQIEPTK